MKVKHKSIVLLAVLAVLQLCSSLWARPTTADEAEKIVGGWLKVDPQPLGTPAARQVGDVETFTNDDGEPVYYIVYLQPAGFVIVSADDLIEPIIGFADDGFFDPSVENPLGALVTNDLNGRIASVKSTFGLQALTKAAPLFETQKKWRLFISLAENTGGLLNATGKSSISDIRVDALVQSRWNQGGAGGKACYNYYTPRIVDNQVLWDEGNINNYPCGCIATAMAQLIRYHKYPDRVEAAANDPCLVKVGAIENGKFEPLAEVAVEMLGGTGENGAYEWDRMALRPNGGTDVNECRAIGALCYDAGISVNMEYSQTASAASLYKACKALVKTFQYENAVCGYSRSGDDLIGGLTEMINPNLDAGNPVILGILGQGAAHAVLADGYGYNVSTLYHHLNMGWSGQYDIWYALPEVNVSFRQYTSVNQCVYNIFKSGSGRAVKGEIISGRVTDSLGGPVSGAIVTAAPQEEPEGDIYTDETDSKGIYALVGLDSGSKYIINVTRPGYEFESDRVDTGTSTDFNDVSGNRWAINFKGISNRFEYLAADSMEIPDDDTITSILDIAERAVIVDLDVELDISHTFDGDLEVYLIAPDNTRVTLFSGIGNDGRDFSGTILDHEEQLPITDGSAPFSGRYHPEGNLSSFYGKDINGIWKLEVKDNSIGNTGKLNYWSLTVIVAADLPGTQTYTLSGCVRTSDGSGISGVTVSASNSGGLGTTGTDGCYSLTVPYDWSGLVTPSKAAHSFTPVHRDFMNVTYNLTDINYTGTQTRTISGFVNTPDGSGIFGVTVSADNSGGSGTTDFTGYYRLVVPRGWSGRVTATKNNFSFNPAYRDYEDVSFDFTNQGYTGTGPPVRTLSITGYVRSPDGSGISGVTLTTNDGSGSGTTDYLGYYSITVTYGWKGQVTPSKEGYSFSPAVRNYRPVSYDRTNRNYTGTRSQIISGCVRTPDGTGVPDVTVSANNGGGSGTTDSAGCYSLIVPLGWSGLITPSKEGVAFTPAYRDYTNVTYDRTNQNFTTTGEPQLLSSRDFATGDFLAMDDFEDYNARERQI